MMAPFGIIYKATNTVNDKVYIGQTTYTLNKRKREHLCSNNDYHFNRALKYYGLNSFEWEVIEYCASKLELDEMEFHYIKQYNSINSGFGYNLTLGGEGILGYKHSKEARLLMSKQRKGRKLSMATKKLISLGNKGKIVSEEARKKISIAHMGKKGRILSEEEKNNISKVHTGKIVSLDTKHKMALAQKGHKNASYGKYGSENGSSKKYVITTPENVTFVVIGLRHFCKLYTKAKLADNHLSACAKGKLAHHKKYKCSYYNEKLDKNIPIWMEGLC
jgi:group I intron endonuclease